jgi:large subunit ribosomal protein L18
VASKTKAWSRGRRHFRIRKTVSGTAEKPRLCVFRSASHIYAQIIDDTRGHTIAAASSLEKDFKDHAGHRGNRDMAKLTGALIGRKAKEKGITKVVFDRGGYLYHGRVKALAEGAREAGLEL